MAQKRELDSVTCLENVTFYVSVFKNTTDKFRKRLILVKNTSDWFQKLFFKNDFTEHFMNLVFQDSFFFIF